MLLLRPSNQAKVAMKKIKSSNGYTILVDDEDFERLNKWSWWADARVESRQPVSSIYRSTKIKGINKAIPIAHELIGRKEGFVTDHINGNVLDNRKANLRFATIAQNTRNRWAWRGEYKGVRIKGSKFRAEIRLDGHYVHLGMFKTKIEAAFAYDFASLMLHGEYGRTNFKHAPPSGDTLSGETE